MNNNGNVLRISAGHASTFAVVAYPSASDIQEGMTFNMYGDRQQVVEIAKDAKRLGYRVDLVSVSGEGLNPLEEPDREFFRSRLKL